MDRDDEIYIGPYASIYRGQQFDDLSPEERAKARAEFERIASNEAKAALIEANGSAP